MSYDIYFFATTQLSTNAPAPLEGVSIKWPGQNSVPVTDSTGMAHGFVAVEQALQFTASKGDFKSQTLTGSSANSKDNPLVFLLQDEGWLSSCFIVSAATGSPVSAEVRRLQQVRKRIGEVSPLIGQLIAEIRREYYKFSPDIAIRLGGDQVARTVALSVIVRPLMAWYDLALVLGLQSSDTENVERHVRAVQDACDGQPGRPLIGEILEAVRSARSLPAETPQALLPYIDRVRQAASLYTAAWAVLDPLVRIWTLENRGANLTEEMSEWLGAAPLGVLPQPSDLKALDVELRTVAGFFDFRPASRQQLGSKLALAWPAAVPSLTRNGFLIAADNPA
jgi:hypothetical protein